ncbi:MAG: ATP-dependent helicase [Sulfurimonas sp.]|nr:ATP-dependent helicase [Sulfurimonas sp.]
MEEEIKPAEKKYYDYISVAKRTTQNVYFVAQHDKKSMFELLLKNSDKKQTVVLTRSKKNADELADYLKSKEIKAVSIHGNHRAEQINDARLSFNVGETTILITTDMILKSMELTGIERVISYDLPLVPQEYFARLILVDEVGESISFVSPDEEGTLETIEFLMKCEMKELELEEFSPTAAPKKEKKKKKPRHTKKRVKKEED